MTPPDPASDARLRKLRFRSWRRGFREADLILGGFADAHLADLSPEELDRYEALLEAPDHDLYAWSMGMAEPDAAYDHDVMHRIRAFRLSAFEAAGPRGG